MPRPLLLAGLLLTLGACQNDASAPAETPADTMAMSPSPNMMEHPAYSDARFLQGMTAHHRMALDMAGMVPTMATSAGLKAMAAKMVTDQQREITEMEGILRAMGETVPDTTAMPGMGKETMMGMPMAMDELHAAQPFDRAFLVSMIGHHSSAITMSAEAQARSTNADVLRLARGIVAMQAEEIGRMQGMLDTMGPAAAADSTMHH